MGTHAGSWKRLGDGSLLTEDAEVGLGHILPARIYLRNLAWLLVLTVITVVVAKFEAFNFGAWNVVLAMAIATLKAGLVATYFMHLKFERWEIWAFVAYPIILVALLIGGSLQDFMDRARPMPMTGPYQLNMPKIPDYGHEGGHGGAHGDTSGHSSAPAGH